MLDRNEILEKAYTECMAEMYAKAQPSADYYQLLEDAKNGKISKDERIYERHYLSQEEFNHIHQKYIDAYNMKEKWHSNVETVEQYLSEGGSKDKYIESHTDENGHYHPGYRSYEKVAPIKNQIEQVIKNSEFYTGSEMDEAVEELVKGITATVMNTIHDCKEFYRFDREENQFSASVALGPSPTSCADTVIEYWKSQGVDIEIIERNPLLIWERDYYGDEFEEVMEYEYGENWEEQWNKKWEELKQKKEKIKNF